MRFIRLLAALLSISILGGTGYAWASYQHFISGLTQVDAIPGAPGGRTDADGPAMNILLVGDDHRPTNATPQELNEISTLQDGGGTNTDTMMIVHLPNGGGAPTVISLPRDSWVDIPGHGKNKLNAAFAFGATHGGDAAGMRLLIETVQDVTGLTIDHFVRVSLLGFYDIANVLGPIQVCLNHPAKDPWSGTDLPAGVSTLNAKQALSFVRQRHGLDQWGGDLAREVRQQYFLSTELHKILSAGTLLNPAKTQALLGAVSSAIETDTGLDLLSLAGRFANLSADRVGYLTLPISGTPTITDAAGNPVSIVQLNTAAIPGFIDGVLNGSQAGPGSSAAPSPQPTVAPINPAAVTVQVINASGRTGLAATNTTALSRLGFHTLTPANGATRSVTTIAYPPGQQARAQAVAAHVPGATVRAAAKATTVTLILGTDGIGVAQPTGTTMGSAPAAASASPQAFTTASCIN